ncbi:capsular polysaccharide synthesis enzyme CpsD exopolysaccharide synthesis [Vibrio maritimus]|uniref:Capsular polysaccharide synthesis enzyme CpsD exopolysaccharide synthesis n=1 Tax=Vibrio maritimus TaxID=990268 RepID=A0A090RVH1_9VIBR|nr:capsular polysaccharide synthesis enzyme CpsD exopolysaccharide synthesis [Vibrio maritimus]
MLIKSQEVKRNDEFIDLSKYTQVIKSNLNRALLFTLVVTMVSIIFVLSMTPVYKSTATLLIEGENNNVVSIERLVGVDTSKQEYFQTQHEIIKSNVIAKKVIERLAIGPDSSTQTLLSYSDEALRSSQPSAMLANLKAQVSDTLYSLPLLNTILVKPRAIKDDQLADFQKLEFLKQFKSNLHVSPIKNTQLVQITFLAEDPDVAAMVANAVGEVYIENHYESQAIINAQASDWISGRLSELEANLRQSELKLVNFMDKEGLVDVSGIDSLASAELTKLIEQLANARDRRLAAESLITVLKQNKNADASYLYTIPQVTNHPQMRDIRLSEIEAEKKVSELSKRYGPKHDKMIQAQAQLKTIQDRSKRTLQRMVAGKEKELVTAKQQERSLKHELAEKKAEFQSFALKRAQYETLQREVDTNRQLYDLFLTRQKEYDATSDFRNVIAQITERAEVPFSPAKPNKPLIVASSAAGAFSFAMIIAFATSALKNTFERRSDLKIVVR